MHSKLIPYLQDHKAHTDLGNEVGQMTTELDEYEDYININREKIGEVRYKEQRDVCIDRRRRLAVFRTHYDYIDGVQHDALSLRRKITLWCNTLRDEVLDGNKFPDKLTPGQVTVMGGMLKEMASVYKENKDITVKTKHTI